MSIKAPTQTLKDLNKGKFDINKALDPEGYLLQPGGGIGQKPISSGAGVPAPSRGAYMGFRGPTTNLGPASAPRNYVPNQFAAMSGGGAPPASASPPMTGMAAPPQLSMGGPGKMSIPGGPQSPGMQPPQMGPKNQMMIDMLRNRGRMM